MIGSSPIRSISFSVIGCVILTQAVTPTLKPFVRSMKLRSVGAQPKLLVYACEVFLMAGESAIVIMDKNGNLALKVLG